MIINTKLPANIILEMPFSASKLLLTLQIALK